jgi:hypothetical protein
MESADFSLMLLPMSTTARRLTRAVTARAGLNTSDLKAFLSIVLSGVTFITLSARAID